VRELCDPALAEIETCGWPFGGAAAAAPEFPTPITYTYFSLANWDARIELSSQP